MVVAIEVLINMRMRIRGMPYSQAHRAARCPSASVECPLEMLASAYNRILHPPPPPICFDIDAGLMLHRCSEREMHKQNEYRRDDSTYYGPLATS